MLDNHFTISVLNSAMMRGYGRREFVYSRAAFNTAQGLFTQNQAIRSLKYDAAKCIPGSKSQDTYYGETDVWTLKSFLESTETMTGVVVAIHLALRETISVRITNGFNAVAGRYASIAKGPVAFEKYRRWTKEGTKDPTSFSPSRHDSDEQRATLLNWCEERCHQFLEPFRMIKGTYDHNLEIYSRPSAERDVIMSRAELTRCVFTSYCPKGSHARRPD
ncbi:hypothetical protein EDD85DRAFT_798301 [Armillaria nabsnona]|nr:hypothetical protein EDD85DRAFT_798301 [Armillaria nabsnona]